MRTPFASLARGALERQIEEQSSAWSTYLERFMDSSLWVDEGGTDPAIVARRVARVAVHGGRARVIATLDAYPVRLIAMLPTAVKDTAFRLAAGLRPLKEDTKEGSSTRRAAREDELR